MKEWNYLKGLEGGNEMKVFEVGDCNKELKSENYMKWLEGGNYMKGLEGGELYERIGGWKFYEGIGAWGSLKLKYELDRSCLSVDLTKYSFSWITSMWGAAADLLFLKYILHFLKFLNIKEK